MIWLLFSFLAAFFNSLLAVFSKKALLKADPYLVIFSQRFLSILVLAPLLFFIDIPTLGNQFWMALVINVVLNLINWILFMYAIKISDLSLVAPLVTLTPLFLLLTSPFIIGEIPTYLGMAGVLLIVVGSYVLNIKKSEKGLLAPFKSLLKQKGPRIMILVAFIWSITSVYDKIGVQNSSPLFWVIAMNGFSACLMLPLVWNLSKNIKVQVRNTWKLLLGVGFANITLLYFQFTALTLTLVSYVISIKRTSAIFSVIFGFFIFKEKGIKERLLGAVIMVGGVVLITLS